MKAFVLETYRKPLRAVEMPEPTPAPHEVLVRMVAAGVNHADERTRTGEFKAVFHLDLPKVMGGELSGEVIAVGEGVTGFRPGDRVYGYTGVVGMGTWAEVVAVDAAALAPAPSSIPLVDAAALPVVALTAWQALVTLGQIQPGQTVLVHGGAGGVGSAVIQLAKHLGATVATTASADSADVVRALVADIVIDYRSEDFVDRLANTPWTSLSTPRAATSPPAPSASYVAAASSSASPGRPTRTWPIKPARASSSRPHSPSSASACGGRRGASACATGSCSSSPTAKPWPRLPVSSMTAS